MDRLTTGRRRARAGSVTVNELIVKQVSPTPCTESSPSARDDVTEPLVVVPASHRRGERGAVQLAKLATIGVATAVLCGAVAVASMVGQQRREMTHQPSRPDVRITGAQALLPDRLDRPLPEENVPAPTTSPPVVATRENATEEVTAAPPATPPPPAQPDDQGPTTGTSTPPTDAPTDLDLVREFYENLPGTPAVAFNLLSPDLVHTSLGEFLQSWALVSAVDDLHVVQRADGVLATVRLRLADGSHLRLQQLLTVAESPRRIVGVQLLSAQRN